MVIGELRVGNWFVGYDNKPFEFSVKDFSLLEKCQIDELIREPIPLTEKWLRKLGFDDKDYKPGYIGVDVSCDNGFTTQFVLTKPHKLGQFQGSYAFEYKAGRIPMFVEFDYVHKLQNFFYALAGQELTFKKHNN